MTILIITGLMLVVLSIAIVRYVRGNATDHEANLHCGLIWLGIGAQAVCWHERWVAIVDAVVAGVYLWLWWRGRERAKA